MGRKLRSICIFSIVVVLIVCFQNCSDEGDIDDQNINNVDLGLLIQPDEVPAKVTLHTFDYNTGESNFFSISRTHKHSFSISDDGQNFICNINDANPYDSLINLVETLRITQPNVSKKDLNVCSKIDLPSQYLTVNHGGETIFVLFRNSDWNNCLSFNPYDLQEEGKRTFITESIDSEEINELVFSGQEQLDVLSCTEEISGNKALAN